MENPAQVRLTALGARADGSRRIEELLSFFPDKDWTAPVPQAMFFDFSVGLKSFI